jgi:ankyrin repeat protein
VRAAPGSVQVLLRAGADVNEANDIGATPLWNATLNGSGAMVLRLLEAGADPNSALLSGETPVMTSARAGSPEIIERLL